MSARLLGLIVEVAHHFLGPIELRKTTTMLTQIVRVLRPIVEPFNLLLLILDQEVHVGCFLLDQMELLHVLLISHLLVGLLSLYPGHICDHYTSSTIHVHGTTPRILGCLIP